MAKHNVYFNLPEREIGKVDANFYIYRSGEKLGTITISRGGLEYYPRKRKKPIRISWSALNNLLEGWERK